MKLNNASIHKYTISNFISHCIMSAITYPCLFVVYKSSYHDDVIKWKHFPRYWPFVRWIHRSPVNSPHKGLWRLRKKWWGWWLWRHCDVIAALSRFRSFLPSFCRGLSASFWRWPELFQMIPRRPLTTPERIPNYTSSGMRNGLTSRILVRIFTHWDRYKMATNFLTKFSNVFS